MNHPVIIAGAGPVGLMLACELGLAGVDVVVMERLAEPSETSPGMAINSATVELFDQRGLMAQLRDGTFELPSGHFSLIWLDATNLDKHRVKSVVLPQTRIEHVLEKRATVLGVQVRRGHEVVGLDQDEAGVVVTVRSAAGEEHIRCSYLVGCDGAGSTVREAAGIAFDGTESRFYGLVGDIKVAFTDLQGEHFGARLCPPLGIYTGAPVGPGVLRVTTAEFDTDPPGPGSTATADELLTSIKRTTGVALQNGEPLWVSRYRNVTRQAERYRAGRVFLAGDAAHVHFPLSGLALNTGIQDAVNLGWKLAADINGWAPPGLLDTYHGERQPIGHRACACAQAQVTLMHPKEASLREIFSELMSLEEVNRYLLGMVLGYDVAYHVGCDGESASQNHDWMIGRRLPHVRLTTAGGESGVAQMMHGGRGVFLTLTGTAFDRHDDLAGWADRVDHLAVEAVPEMDPGAVLVRPDGHVVWVAPADGGRGGLRQALTRWFGKPNPASDAGPGGQPPGTPC